MQKLYKIVMRHCAPKDCEDSIYGYVIANDEKEVLDYVDQECMYGTWQDRSNEDRKRTIYDDEYNEIGEETYMEYMLRIRGEINDEDADYSDLYYGLTLYGWEEGVEVADYEVLTLRNLKIATQVLPL